jgi:hypothetical protein
MLVYYYIARTVSPHPQALIMFVHVCLLWAGERKREDREARNGSTVWHEALSDTITEPITCLERAVQATNIVVLINKLLSPQETI